jgi:hypothetical protein
MRFQKNVFIFSRFIAFSSLFLFALISCKKTKNETIPSVETVSVTDITSTTAKVNTSVTSDGGVTVTGTGVCWGNSINPDLSNNVSNVGAGTGAFISILTGLQPNTTYHVRAFATNNIGTAYGADLTFATLP